MGGDTRGLDQSLADAAALHWLGYRDRSQEGRIDARLDARSTDRRVTLISKKITGGRPIEAFDAQSRCIEDRANGRQISGLFNSKFTRRAALIYLLMDHLHGG